MAGVRGLELGNVVLRHAGPNSLLSQNNFVPETFPLQNDICEFESSHPVSELRFLAADGRVDLRATLVVAASGLVVRPA
jgi:hypothetical protein